MGYEVSAASAAAGFSYPAFAGALSLVFELLPAFVFGGCFFEKRIKNLLIRVPAYIAAAAAVFFAGYLGLLPEVALHLLVIFTASVFLAVFYRGGLKAKANGALVIFILVTASVMLYSLAHSMLDSIILRGEKLTEQKDALAVLSIMSVITALLTVTLFLLRRQFAGRGGYQDGAGPALLCVPVFTLVTFAVFRYCLDNMPGSGLMTVFICMAALGLVFVNVLVFVLFARLSKRMDVKRENDVLSAQLAVREDSISNLEAAYNRTRAFRHDMQNHLLVLGALSEQKKYGELGEYIRQMNRAVDESAYVRISGIPAVDAILNEKMYSAQAQSIRTDFEVRSLEYTSVRALDICVILSNALDNAFEANLSVPEDSRYIRLKASAGNGTTVISVSNPVGVTPEKDPGTGLYPTTKDDRANHGFGLKSIALVADKYGADFLCRAENGVFAVIVRFEEKEEKSK